MSDTPAAAASEPIRLPVARVAVDVPLPHLDRLFDYRVEAGQDHAAAPGTRVRVRFSGQLRDGFVVERVATSDSARELSALSSVISPEPVLTPEIVALVRAVAEHYAGTFADVVRLAVPTKHGATERADRVPRPPLTERPKAAGALDCYPNGTALLDAIAGGGRPRAYWQLVPAADPSGDWADGFAAAARACADSGRGAVLVVPDQRDLTRLKAACTKALGRSGFVVLTADSGPAARYRAFLAALRGEVKVVIGNRAAAYAPVRDLGLVALWDDGDDTLAERRSPYPHTRTVLALRAGQQQTAVLFAGYSRSCEVEWWLQRGWLRELAMDRSRLRQLAPQIRVAGDSDFALARDPAARVARLPHEVFELIRGLVPQGPILVQVPRAGYLVALVCHECGEPARCRRCQGPLRSPVGGRSPAGGRPPTDGGTAGTESAAARGPAPGPPTLPGRPLQGVRVGIGQLGRTGRSGTSLSGGGLPGGTSLSGGGLPGGTSLSGGGLPGGTSLSGGGLPGGTSLSGGGLPGGTSLSGGGLPGGTSLSGGTALLSTGLLGCGSCGQLEPDWTCAICGGRRLKAPILGAERTADELGRAFPKTVIRQSSGSNRLTEVPDTPALVITTPGAEPTAAGGYAGAVLLDTNLLLLRADLRASEEALRRWLAVASLVRTGADGGSVIAVGDSSARALQALVRLDPAGLAARELAERAEAHFPPAAKLITIEGGPAALAELIDLLQPPDPTEILGPVPTADLPAKADDPIERLTLRTPLSTGAELVRAVKQVGGVRSARKSEGALRMKVDPSTLA